MRALVVPVLVAAASLGCLMYRAPAPPPVSDHAAQPLRIYVVLPLSSSRDTVEEDWRHAAEFSADLEAAGFEPSLAARASAVPPNMPWIGDVTRGEDERCESLMSALTLLSLGVIPLWGCERYGARFELHSFGSAPAQLIDTMREISTIFGWFAYPIGAPLGYSVARTGFVPREVVGDYPVRSLRAAILNALEVPEP